MNTSHIEAAFWEEEEAAPNSFNLYKARRAANGISPRVMPMSLNSRSDSLFSSTHVSRYFRQLVYEWISFIVDLPLSCCCPVHHRGVPMF